MLSSATDLWTNEHRLWDDGCMEPRNRLIVALDVPGKEETLSLARTLGGVAGMVKIGIEGFTAHGPDLVRAVRDLGLGVFLDLKMHDIPRTAAAGVRGAVELGVDLITVHALGGPEMVRAAAEAAEDRAQLIAVTLLTSMDEQSAAQVGLAEGVAASAERLGSMALASGARGLVCAASELGRLSKLGGTRVVPGIRPAGAASGDQKRVATPREAVEAGATWIVVGRPIVRAPDPLAAARAIVAELG